MGSHIMKILGRYVYILYKCVLPREKITKLKDVLMWLYIFTLNRDAGTKA